MVYGTDYPTRDGTCVRDYIHIDDLADAHVLALDFLKREKRSEVMNLGYGEGYTVLEIISAMKKVSGVDFKVETTARRPGDAEAIYADNSKLLKLLGWKPKYKSIDVICQDGPRLGKEPPLGPEAAKASPRDSMRERSGRPQKPLSLPPERRPPSCAATNAHC